MSSQKVFVTGATGYIGGSVAVKLVEQGYQVTGLVRTQSGVERLKEAGIEPFMGTLNDYESLKQIAKEHDLVINAADSDHPYVITTILSVLEGTGKKFVHTSGSSIVGDKAMGEFGDKIYHEETIDPKPEKLARAMIDQTVLRAANRGVHTIVICPTLIYGEGLGVVNKDSIQVPNLIKLALKKGVANHIGKGENVWSNVHIKDLVDLYMLAIDRAPAGSFFFAENGEASMKEIAEAINRIWNLGTEIQSIADRRQTASGHAARSCFE
jgi:nucleoside-diphosphate-sugar epimerase